MLPQLKLAQVVGKPVRAVNHFGYEKDKLIIVFDDGFIYFEAHGETYEDIGGLEEAIFRLEAQPVEKVVALGIATEEEIRERKQARIRELAELRDVQERLKYEELKAKFEPQIPPAPSNG